jgi:N-acetyl-gamma-glutamyl-phosphate reductase
VAHELQTAIFGATGYSGFELTRIVSRHPHLKPPLLLRREGGEGGAVALEDLYPHLAGQGPFPLETFSWERLAAAGVKLLFLATPHELSRELVPEALRRGLRVVDLSGAWRLKVAANRAVYRFTDADPAAAARLDALAVYGSPELHRDAIATAPLVANPGCYATSIILALAPLAGGSWLDKDHGVICDSKSGVSGAGKTPTAKTHFCEVATNLSAYSLLNHRHTGEILEQLELSAAQVTFTPHLLPIPRGILSTVYVRLARPLAVDQVVALYRDFYLGCPWVRIFAKGVPQIQYSLHTNYCDLGFALAADGQRLIIVSCLDNLLKGAAGQAVQNLNLMYGWDEREGLQ